LRRVELAYAGSAFGLYANSVAVAVYSYGHGGATAVGLVLFARLGISALAAPFAATLADRFPQERVMLVSDLGRVATVVGTAVAAASEAPALVYVLATLTSILGTVFRPAEASLIPVLARSPEELTAANVTSSTFDSVGAFAGPAGGAFLLAVGGPTVAFAAVAVTYLWSASFVARIRVPERPSPGRHLEDESAGFVAGFRAVRAEPRLRLLIALYGAQTLVAGAYGVLVVVIALKLLGLGNAGVGLLQAATGVGAVIGAGTALALVSRKRTGGDLGLGLLFFGAPLLLIAAIPRPWAAILALAILGVGNSVVDISAMTLIQRTAPPAVAGRVFGLLESTLVGALGIGSLAAPLLVHLIGIRGALLVAGAFLPVLAAVAQRSLAKVDARADVPEEQLRAIDAVPFLDALPLERKEALAAALERVVVPAGQVLFAIGDPGDRLYILAEGTLQIELPEGPKIEHAPAFVGEIALLRGIPRTATVRSSSDATLWALDADAFVSAVNGHGRSRSAAEAVMASRGAVFAI
jgi:MFS family permease